MNPSCFLIDDDLDDQEMFCDALFEVNKNVKCQIANSGEEALEKVQSDSSFIPDFIFIDVNMPLMNGFVCLKELRRFDHLKNTKMIMYSTSAEEKLAGQSRELGAFDYVVKPPQLNLLKEKLFRLMSSDQIT